MSIQRRLAISVTLVLFFSLVIGFVLTYAHVISKVRIELQAALDVGVHTALNSVNDKLGSSDPAAELPRIVAEFNGDRHLRAVLARPDGTIVAQSRLLPPEDPAPDWFYRIVTRPLPIKALSLPPRFQPYGNLRLEADPRNEVAEAWSDTRLTVAIMALFFGMVLALVFVTIRAALAPIRDVCAALERIGTGDYQTRIDPKISHELAPLREGFDHMAERLQQMGRQNRALHEQIMTLQEEERAELARDLHDDVAPFLFAVGADAAMIRRFLADDAVQDIAPRAESIADAVKHMQRHLKDVLRRLAPGALLDLGLHGAIDNLIAFWTTRQPRLAFNVQISDEPLEPPLDAVAFRVVQESISNAIRHGCPSSIDIKIVVDDARAIITVVDDGTGFAASNPNPGFGLTGMQERVHAVGGALKARNRGDGPGAIVETTLPLDRKGRRASEDVMDVTA